jgi:hypothetical protein
MSNTSLISALVAVACLAGTECALAQSVGPDETITPNGAVIQKLELTPAQEGAIYNAVIQQRIQTSRSGISFAIGAPVPQAVELGTLPDEVAADNPWAPLLRYAMVDDAVVVVDAIRMRVVDVIHHGAKP